MALTLFLSRIGNSLFAQSAMAIEQISTLQTGKEVKCVVTSPRNLKHHKMLFALLNIVWENQPDPPMFPTLESLLDAIKIATGHTREIYDLDGNLYIAPASISFAEMDQENFRQWFDKAVNVIIEKILYNLNKATVYKEVFNILGENLPDEIS